MTDGQPNHLSFEGILNFRDVGAHVNKIIGSDLLKPGCLFRSARPDKATEADRDKLVNNFGIKTIIDLRTDTEHINATKERQEGVAFTTKSDALPSTEDISDHARIPGIDLQRVNLNGKSFERHLAWQLSYFSLARLVLLMAMGYRTEGIAVLGREVMMPRGLTGIGVDTLDHSGPEVKQFFDLLAEESAWPVMINCTQGKDRTGMTVMLVLLLCGVDIQTITRDYVLSEPELEPEKAERMVEITKFGLDESFTTCPPDFCEKILGHLNTSYGGIESYLEHIGVDRTQQESIKTKLLI